MCLLVPYFGQWPPLFDVYLQACANNPALDVTILTDIEPPRRAPGNIRFLPTTLRQLRESCAEQLGYEVALSQPYKICDFRPAFGVVLQQYLTHYEFWAHGDLDVVYGDLSPVLSRETLDRFDVVSCKREWTSGSLCLFRNVPSVNDLFRTSADHRMVLRSPEFLAFDETSYM